MTAAPLNYTTTISVEKTIGEMQAMLSRAGASRVSVDYDEGHPTAVTFMLSTPHGDRFFTLPVDVEAMHRNLIAAHRSGQARSLSKAVANSVEQAERVAWRVVKDWLAAQLTLVAAKMASLDQVMLPYLHVADDGQTLYQSYREREQVLALEVRP